MNDNHCPDIQGFLQEVDRIKADLNRINHHYGDDHKAAAEAIRQLWQD